MDVGERFNLKLMFFLNIYYHFMVQTFQMIDDKFSKWYPSFNENYDVMRQWGYLKFQPFPIA